MTTDNIKDEAAQKIGFLDFADYENINYPHVKSLSEKFLNQCISLALSQKPEAGITIEQAKDKREEVYTAVFKNATTCYHFPELKELVQLCMDEYASLVATSAAQSAREEERKRILDALPTKSEVEKEVNSRIWRISDYDQWFKDNVKQYSEQMAKWVIERIQSIINHE